MTPRRILRALALGVGLGAAALAPGCAERAPEVAVVAAPMDPGPAECGVCGMTVRDQPSPRGQALHRGGERRHYCSLGDLRAALQTPSPLGAPVAVWVEDLGPGFDAAATDVTPRPWIPAGAATYVVGIERPGVMGKPVLSFGEAEHADGALGLPGAHRTSWQGLSDTPFHEVPTKLP